MNELNNEKDSYFGSLEESSEQRIEEAGSVPAEDVRDEFKRCQEDFVYWFETYYKPVKYKK